MNHSILITKLHIPLDPDKANLVRRSHLFEQLNAGKNKKLTIVSAPAGFGKTTLLSHWARDLKQPVAWIPLNKDDDDSYQFWSDFISSIGCAIEGLGQKTLEMIQSLPSKSISDRSILTTLINGISASDQNICVILDDYHVITHPEIHSALKFLIDYIPHNMRLILSSRSMLQFSLGRLRVQDQILEIQTGDLKFSLQETTTYLKDIKRLDLSRTDIDDR